MLEITKFSFLPYLQLFGSLLLILWIYLSNHISYIQIKENKNEIAKLKEKLNMD